MFENFKNWLIRKLVKNTNLHAPTIYAVLGKMSRGEVESFSSEICKKIEIYINLKKLLTN